MSFAEYLYLIRTGATFQPMDLNDLIVSKGAAIIFISKSNFIKNSGTAGGALNIFGVDKLRVSDSKFAHNMARNINNITTNCE